MKSKSKVAAGCAVGCTAFLIVVGLVGVVVLGPVFLGMRHTQKKAAALHDPKVYDPVGELLALYCQLDHSLLPDHLGYAWLPEELNAVSSGWGAVHPESAFIEMGGGFHHFGYLLSLDPTASVHGKNAWQLYMQSEGSTDVHLKTFLLDPDQQLSPEEILAKVIAGFDAQINLSPKDQRAYEGKIDVFLDFDRVEEAQATCRQMLAAMPDEWWPVLINCLIVAEEESIESAETILVRWVEKDRNFFRYLDLAYFYQLTDKPGKAAEAMLQATKYDANTNWGHGGNSNYRGYTAVQYAYRSGEYEAVVQLCDHLMKVTINGDYAKLGLRKLKLAAVEAQQQSTEARVVAWDDHINTFDPFEHIDIEKLLHINSAVAD